MAHIGDQIIAARKAKGMTQDALAQALELSRSTVAHWESGRTHPSVEMMMRLSRLLDYDFISAASQLHSDGDEAGPVDDIDEAPLPEADEAETTDMPLPEAGIPKPRRRRWPIIAIGAVLLLACAALILVPRLRKSEPEVVPAVDDVVDAGTVTKAFFQQNNPEQEGKAYFGIDCLLQTTKSQDIDVWMYTLNLHEKHGVGFAFDRLETYTFVGDTVDERSFDPDFLTASGVPNTIEAYGDWHIIGGLPVDERVRGIGFVLRGTDDTGTALSFVFYQPLAAG